MDWAGSESELEDNGHLSNRDGFEIDVFLMMQLQPESVAFRISSHWQTLAMQHDKGGR